MSEKLRLSRREFIAGALATAGAAAFGVSRSCEDNRPKDKKSDTDEPIRAASPTVSEHRESLMRQMRVDSGASGSAGKGDTVEDITEIKSEPLGETELTSVEVIRDAQAYLQGISQPSRLYATSC